MPELVKVEFIGWEDDFRYAEEKSRITEHIQKLAKDHGFTSACVQDMIMKYRYRSQGPFVDVHFGREEVVGWDGKPVVARLWFDEDGDLCKDPEFF